MPTPSCALDAACLALGGQQRLADALTKATPDTPITSSAISQWRRRLVPLERCEPIEAVTAGRVRCEQLRPDLCWRRDGRGRVVAVAQTVKPTPRGRRPVSHVERLVPA